VFQIETQLNDWFEDKQQRIDAMNTEIAQAVLELVDSDKWQQFLEASTGFHQYSFRNQLLIAIQRPSASKVASKSFWLQHGRKLKPFGERGNGISILGGGKRRVVLRGEDGQPILDEEGNRQYQSFMSYRSVTVYDADQTIPIDPDDGVAMSLANRSDRTDDPERVQALLNFSRHLIEGAGYTIVEHPLSHNGRTDPANKIVKVDAGLGDLDKAMTMTHEMAHIYCGHVDGDILDYLTHRGQMEVEAEGVAYVLANHFGLAVHEDTTFYMAGWAQHYAKTNGLELEEALMAAGQNISTTVRRVLDGGEIDHDS